MSSSPVSSGLFSEDDDLANVGFADFQLFADLQEFLDGNRRTAQSLLGLELAAFDPFRDGHFAFARRAAVQRPSRADTNGPGRWFSQSAGREIELNIFI